ncbi:unnamed protein product [Paramecium octaurelia]|uniref:TRAF3-interacting protein 1 n=1 Tax=Paramecium octaurelia TaxID=43137 RepID=A0A8S1W7N6_PAROT|nr:unnamed protein product [Paramecium octaurelia]
MADFWKPTADLYSALFEKPKMTQKLLEKPPFKYIFDIIMETTKLTGFINGLYTDDELDVTYYDNKQKKLMFLQKIIELTSMMLKEEIAAKPGKIAAGLEPENTNLLLQAIYRAAVSGKNSAPYIEDVLAIIGANPKDQEVQAQAIYNCKPIQQQIPNESKLLPYQIIQKQQQQIQELENELKQKNEIILQSQSA